MAMTRVHLVIHGEVQGVFYRASAQEKALALGLSGWVRNLDSGDVEAEAEGPQDLVDGFVAWCRQGPRAARVERVDVEKRPFGGDLTRFSVVR